MVISFWKIKQDNEKMSTSNQILKLLIPFENQNGESHSSIIPGIFPAEDIGDL